MPKTKIIKAIVDAMTASDSPYAPPATVERKGKSSKGGSYKLTVSVAGLELDGVEVPNDLAANAIADTIEKALTQQPRAQH